jgi:hydrogenase maturation protease
VNRILVAGVGNVFLSDDAFGVAVVRRLPEAALPPGVEVVDVGIRGMHLAYQLLDGYDALVLVDTVRRGSAPGSLHVLEHDLDAPVDRVAALDAHVMEPAAVLAMLDELAAGAGIERPVGRVLVLGCEPLTLAEGLGLSAPVTQAVDRAVSLLLPLVEGLATAERKPDAPHPADRTARGVGDRHRPIAP